MASIKMAILDSLETLSEKNYDRFCMALVDRRGERRVPLSKVEKQSRVEVTNVLVSTFTEAQAPSVVSELFRVIRCFDEAEDLDENISKIERKAARDKSGRVTERRPVRGAAGPSVDRDASAVENHKAAQSQSPVARTAQVTMTSPDVDDAIARIDNMILNLNISTVPKRTPEDCNVSDNETDSYSDDSSDLSCDNSDDFIRNVKRKLKKLDQRFGEYK
ncbi:uncharacterized protein LOC144072654 isoform X2 [Stigmatopora argus]